MAAAMQIPGAIDPVPVPRAAPARADGRVEIIGLTKPELREALVAAGIAEGQAKMRASQIWQWIYNRGVTDFDSMSNIAKEARALLAEKFSIERPEVVTAQVSTDGTRKWLLRSTDGQEYEMVFIPDADRGTLCVSSPVGCTVTWRFCNSRSKKQVRNLEPA